MPRMESVVISEFTEDSQRARHLSPSPNKGELGTSGMAPAALNLEVLGAGGKGAGMA